MLHESSVEVKPSWEVIKSMDLQSMARSKPSFLKVRFLPISWYLLELSSGGWALECGVLTSPRA